MTQEYYDRLAPYYKLMLSDWEASVERQAAALDGVIREVLGRDGSKAVLDAACGIGTQSIGLAKLGYAVTASDLSPGSVAQARQEAIRHAVSIDFHTADMRRTWDTFQRTFDVVIACDNAVPHLLDEGQIRLAFDQFYRCTRPGGCCIISVRDYAHIERSQGETRIYPRLVHPTETGQVVLLDVWRFSGRTYEMTTYIIEDDGGPGAATTVVRGGTYFWVEISTLEELFRQAGFREVNVLRERFFQPLLVAKK
jgi:SAM-dependent methyltransferase